MTHEGVDLTVTRNPFTVERAEGGRDRWSVYLHHQCAQWQVTQPEEWQIGVEYVPGTPHGDAVRQLNDFIEHARAALAALCRREEMS